MSYLPHLLINYCIFLTLAISLNYVVGYCGLMSLAHASFFAIGAYSYAIATVAYEWWPSFGFILGMVLSLLLSLPLAMLAWRLRGDYFVMASLALQTMVYGILVGWYNPEMSLGSIRNLTNGPIGITSIPRPEIPGFSSNGLGSTVFLSVLLTVICVLITRHFLGSPWGRTLVAMRDDEIVSESLGKSTRRLKTQAITISAGLAAIAGSLHAAHLSFIEPGIGDIHMSILILSMVIVGGSGNPVRGAMVGALVLLVLQELFGFMVPISASNLANLRVFLYGLTLVLFMHARRQGLAGTYKVE